VPRFYFTLLNDFLEYYKFFYENNISIKELIKKYMENKKEKSYEIQNYHLENPSFIKPHPFKENYLPENQLSTELIKQVFTESIIKSIPYDVTWFLIKKPQYTYKEEYLKKFLLNSEPFVFLYQIPNEFILFGVKNEMLFFLSSHELLKDSFLSTIIENEAEIVNFLIKYDWTKFNLNKHSFFWDLNYQIIVASYLDLVSGGISDYLPENWGDPFFSLRDFDDCRPGFKIIKLKKEKIKKFRGLINKWKNENNKNEIDFEFLQWYKKI